jgi:hypothetical protein
MTTQRNDQEKRRPIILEGLSRNMKTSEIASQLGVKKWVIKRDIRKMRYNRNPKLKRAYKTADEAKEKNMRSKANRAEEKFQDMTGMTLEEKTFLNMLHYYRPELVKILSSNDENPAINKLASSTKRCLKKHGIIVTGWKESEITPKARKYLEDPEHKI